MITKQQFIDFQHKYHTDSKLSKVLDLSISRICQLRKFYGIPVYTIKKENRIRDRFIYRMFKENKISKKELAKNNNLSYKTILRIIKDYDNK